MSFALVKLSFNNPGDSNLEGGICGTGFFIGCNKGVTAHHVLNEGTFIPNSGYLHCYNWIITRKGRMIPIVKDDAQFFPEIETTIINVDEMVSSDEIYELDSSSLEDDIPVKAFGHIGNAMPQIEASWNGPIFNVSSACLDSTRCDAEGTVLRTVTMSINSADIQLHGVKGFELSFPSRVGMSGGPVISAKTNKAIGMLSLGLPADCDIKKSTFAVSAIEISRFVE